MQATAESEFAGRDGSLTGAGTYSLRDGSLLKDGAGTYSLEGSEGEDRRLRGNGVNGTRLVTRHV